MKDWDLLKELCPRLYKNGIVFECGLGWYQILYHLSIKIEMILEDRAEKCKIVEDQENEYNEMYAVQVKEKYGTLRFYMSCETDEISELIREYEALSSQTCESCGAPAKMRGRRWIEVKCDKCYQEKS